MISTASPIPLNGFNRDSLNIFVVKVAKCSLLKQCRSNATRTLSAVFKKTYVDSGTHYSAIFKELFQCGLLSVRVT